VLECRDRDEPRLRHYYRPADDIDEACYRELDASPEQVVAERFASLLKRAVSSTLMSDAPLGVFVSGGVDSSVLAALAKRSLPALPLFSSNVVGKDSEIVGARALASFLGCRLHESRFAPESFLAGWAHATWHHEVPIVRHMSAVPLAAVA